MSSKQPSGPWVSAMFEVGAVNPRIPTQASWRRLAAMAGLAPKTVIDAANGDATATPDTLRALARALRVDVETVSSWISDDRVVSSRYAPPAEAALLTDRQRKALTELIRSMAAGEQRAGEEHAQRRSAPMKPETVQWPEAPAYDDPTGFYEAWDQVAAGAIARRTADYVQLIVEGLDPDADVEPDEVTDMLEAALSAGMARAILEGVEEASFATLAVLESGPASGPLRDAFGLAAHRGTPAHGKDTTTGEHSQDPDDYQP